MTTTTSETTCPQLLPTVEDFSRFTFKDWLNFADLKGFKPRWAYETWIELVSAETLGQLSLEDWEAIAEAIDYKETWAYHRFKEHKAK